MVLTCDAAARALGNADRSAGTDTLRHGPLRVLSWNIHKQGDAGWDHDLAEFAAQSDVVLVQEAAMQPSLLRIFDQAGLGWVMASSFMSESEEFGVMTATRISPVASCTQRATEPLIRIPKSSVITWLSTDDPRQPLAVVNVHAVNFELVPDVYRAQMEALADVLVDHRGPIVFGGDFNTWSDERDTIVHQIMTRLGLTEVGLQSDRRALFFGRHLDHLFVRGLEAVDAEAIPVTSSDHNPLSATLLIH